MSPSGPELTQIIPCAATTSVGLLDALKNFASVAALPVAGLTFWLGYRQKEKERTRSYYHKVVVDVVLPDILIFFEQQQIALRTAGEDALKGAASPRRAIPRSCKAVLASFGTGLFELQDKIVQRTAIFDDKVTRDLVEAFPKIQDDVTDWFSAVDLQKKPEVNNLSSLLRASQRTVIRRLYTGESKNF